MNKKKIAKDSKENPKAFWNYVNSKTKSKQGVCDFIKEDGSTSNDEENAEILKAFFLVYLQMIILQTSQKPILMKLFGNMR